ncbi:phosphatase [Desulfurococcus amylolyticus]|uniref:phosphatase n=1 Tax=Desulfurococcus amylolyticus TaxID=94694 RepID=UPI0005B20452|nr:phosphatase [Desulfurococcus amylolyticus]
MAKIAVALDYDGVLIDSYRGIPLFYLEDFPALTGMTIDYARQLLYLEYLTESLSVLREDLWPRYIPDFSSSLFDELITRYWEKRIEYSRSLPGVKPVLNTLKNQVDLYHVGHRDDIYGLKTHRIYIDGFTDYFKYIYVVEENTESRLKALMEILETHDLVIYVDDKPVNLAVIEQGLKDLREHVVLVRQVFKSLYDTPWIDPVEKYIAINNLSELSRLIRRLSQ